MRMLFSCLAGYGSLHPLLLLSLAAKKAGHEVAFATGGERRSTGVHSGQRGGPADRQPGAQAGGGPVGCARPLVKLPLLEKGVKTARDSLQVDVQSLVPSG